MVYGRSNVHDSSIPGHTDDLGKQTDRNERQDLDMTWLMQEIDQSASNVLSLIHREVELCTRVKDQCKNVLE